jgi:hypothetical protein
MTCAATPFVFSSSDFPALVAALNPNTDGFAAAIFLAAYSLAQNWLSPVHLTSILRELFSLT